MNWNKLNKPPIKEAVFDIRFAQNDALTLQALKSFCDLLENQFPVVNEMFLFQVEAKLEESGDQQRVDSKRLNNGFRLSNNDRSFILQVRLDGLTLSKLEPYISWEELHNMAKPLILALFEKFPQLKFNRIALRYINQFDLNFEHPINEYLNIQPLYPDALPQTIDAFTLRLLIPKKELNLKSISHLSIEPLGISDSLYKVIFDIDVSKESIYTIDDSEILFADFDNVRNYKNEIFFNGLTEKTLNLFK